MTTTTRSTHTHDDHHAKYELGRLPHNRRVRTVDEVVVHSRLATIFNLAVHVERWPELLPHYRYVRFRERDRHDSGIVEMAANRPFGPVGWPTWWVSQMYVQRQVRGPKGHGEEPLIRYRHIEGVTTGMDVEWTFHPVKGGTRVRIVHVWNGPRWPLLGGVAARTVIAPVFVHGIAQRTLAGLARVAEAEPL